MPLKVCHVAAGYVIHSAFGCRTSYGELTAAVARLRVPVDPPLKPRAEWRSIGCQRRARDIQGAAPHTYRPGLLDDDHARGRRVLAALGEACGWTRPRRPDRFLGLAYNEGFGSISAQAVELSRSGAGALRIERVVVVVVCGTAVNPGNIRAQIEGGALFALSAALREEAIFKKGRLKQRNLNSYPVLRMADARPVEVHILETPESPIGGMERLPSHRSLLLSLTHSSPRPASASDASRSRTPRFTGSER